MWHHALGTALGEAIRQGIRSLTTVPDRAKVLIIMTDGEDHGSEPLVAAQEAAEAELRAKGFADYYRHLDVMRAQNLSNLQHAHVIVIRSEFSDVRGKPRSAMGCGFASNSYRDAELDAVRDLQAYFWGWKPDQHGYQVVRKFRY